MELGSIKFEFFGVPLTATYDGSTGWICQDPDAQKHLTLFTSDVTEGGSHLPEPARGMLEAGAACMGGEVVNVVQFRHSKDPDVVH